MTVAWRRWASPDVGLRWLLVWLFLGARGWHLFERLCPTGTQPSRPVDLETAVDGSGNGLQVIWVRADHEVMAADGSLHHAHVDDVGGGGAARERTHGAGLAIVESLHVASG